MMQYKLAALGLAAVICLASAIEIHRFEDVTAAKSSRRIVLTNITVPAGATLNLENLLPGTRVEFAGRTTFGYEEWPGPLIFVSGDRVRILGLQGHLIDCDGARWWDWQGGNGGKTKPKFFKAKLTNSAIEDLNVKNLPVHGFWIHGENISMANINIDSRDGKTQGGHNTDGFDTFANNLRITNTTVVNQDDCIAVKDGRNVVFEKSLCIGGHGISVGSIGDGVTVENVLVRHCRVVDSENGIRVKTVKDAKNGIVNGVTYEDITLKDVTNGIVVQGNYENLGPKGDPTGGVPVRNLVVKDVRGSVLPGGTNVYIWVTNASDWTFESVNVYGGMKHLNCTGIPNGTNIRC